MAQDHSTVPVLTMQDELGITYLINSAQEFWSGESNPAYVGPHLIFFPELEDVLTLPQDEAPTLFLLDSTLRRFVALCSTYHGLCSCATESRLTDCRIVIQSNICKARCSSNTLSPCFWIPSCFNFTLKECRK